MRPPSGGYSKHSPQDKDGVAKTLDEYMTGQGNYRTHDLAAVCLRRRIGIRLSIELALARHGARWLSLHQEFCNIDFFSFL